MLRIAVTGSDRNTCHQITDLINRITKSREIEVDVVVSESVERFLFSFEPVYDMIFIEAAFPAAAVPEIVKRLRKRSGSVDLIFLTNGGSYDGQLQEGGALVFIPKSVNEEQFEAGFLHGVERLIFNRIDHILLKTAEGTIRLGVRQIYYLETLERMLYYHTAIGTYCVRKSLRAAQQELEGFPFAKCNQCYLVNLTHVTDVRDDSVVVGERVLEISRRNRKSFMDAMIRHIGHS